MVDPHLQQGIDVAKEVQFLLGLDAHVFPAFVHLDADLVGLVSVDQDHEGEFDDLFGRVLGKQGLLFEIGAIPDLLWPTRFLYLQGSPVVRVLDPLRFARDSLADEMLSGLVPSDEVLDGDGLVNQLLKHLLF